MARARNNGMFDFLTKKKVTYKRSVPKASRRRKATDEKPATWTREDAEKALKRWKRLGYNPAGNPAESAPQYRLAQAVLSGTAKLKGMSKKAAQEIVDRTPANLRSAFMKRNPVEAAAELSEAWSGKPASTEEEYTETIRYHSVLTGLARLVQIKVWVDERHVKAIDFDAETKLGSNEKGEQLYVVGGDQSLSLSDFGITGHAAEKDLVVIGSCYSVTYFTAKYHLGKADKTPGPYEHVFSEHGEEEPEILYDTMNDLVQFAGGEYHIPIDIDGKYSSGINN